MLTESLSKLQLFHPNVLMKIDISSGFYLIILEILKLHIVVALLVLAAVLIILLLPFTKQNLQTRKVLLILLALRNFVDGIKI